MSKGCGREISDEMFLEVKKYCRIINGYLFKTQAQANQHGSPYIWKKINNKKSRGGYICLEINSIGWKYARLMMMLHLDRPLLATEEVDHIDGNRANNRIENLRIVTDRENCLNMKTHREGRLPGYSIFNGKYVAQIGINGKNVNLGQYDSMHEAHNAYNKALKYIGLYKDNKQFRSLLKEI